MARYHFWGFIVNEAGEPIENAEVSIKLAGTDTLACLYLDEFSSYTTCGDPSFPSGPQLQTLDNGYYEFWVADETEPHGYRYDQKFKIQWERIGIAKGMIDNVNVLPLTMPVFPANISTCTSAGTSASISTEMNKLVSDALVCKWDKHSRQLVDISDPHGLEFVDITKTDTRPNKIISNELGWIWSQHEQSTIQLYNVSAGPPHNLHEVDLNSVDPIRNKVVSNKDMHELYINMMRSYEKLIIQSDWVTVDSTNELWYYDIIHKLDTYYPHVTCYNNISHEIEKMATVRFIDNNTIRIIVNANTPPMQPDIQIWVKISG